MTEQKTSVDAVTEIREQMTDYLCVCGVRDVALVVGAVGTGLVAGFVGHQVLRGRWRAAPVVVSLALCTAAMFTKRRFVVKSALAVGGATMLLSTVHFTFWEQIEEDLILEA
ncbi:MAG: hypothetical protein R3F65_32240 [bacterium]